MKFLAEFILIIILVAIALWYAKWHSQRSVAFNQDSKGPMSNEVGIIEESHPFFRLLATKYEDELEDQAIEILNSNPEIASMVWPGPDEQGKPFIKNSTALHYAANDGKLRLMKRLIELGADVNASDANWYRSVLSWAANNAHVEAVKLLLDHGASPDSLNAVHAAAFGGSDCGAEDGRKYVETIKTLVAAGADPNDRRFHDDWTPLKVAIDSGNQDAIEYLRSINAEED